MYVCVYLFVNFSNQIGIYTLMANKPRVVCHKERVPTNTNSEIQFESSAERFISADEFLKEFSFSIDSEESKRFTNNFVDIPGIKDSNGPPFSNKSPLNPFLASSLQDLTSNSDTQLRTSQSDSSSLKLVKGKQQSLTDISGEAAHHAKKKPQRKPVSKPQRPPSSVKTKRPDAVTLERRTVTTSRGRTTPPSEYRSKSRNTTLQKYILEPNSQAPPLDTFSLHSTPFPQPHKHPQIEVTLPPHEDKNPGLPLDLQNGLLLSAIHLNLSAQKTYADTEKEALLQLSKLHAYKQKLIEENYKLRRELERLEFELVAKFAGDELVSVEEVIAKLNLAGAQIQKLSEALIKAQSTVRLRRIQLSERDREQCEKNLRELSSAATHSLTNMRALLGQVPGVCDRVQKTAKDSEEDLERVKEANKKLDEFVSVMLSKVSLQSHISLLEENITLAKDPTKYFSFDMNDIDPF